MNDPRLLASNGRVAHVTLRGQVEALEFVEGDWARVQVPVCDLTRRPNGARDRQLLLGERVLVLEVVDGIAFLETERDGYVGYTPNEFLGPDVQPTHWVAARQSHLYTQNDFKTPEAAAISCGSWLCVMDQGPRFARLDTGHYVPNAHIRAWGDWGDDPAGVAEMFLGTPYLWGGNCGAGIDCSGLVQAALLACGRPCPRDSDQQERMNAQHLGDDTQLRRGDLVFWKGHVGMMLDTRMLIHANAFHMATAIEPLATAKGRILANEFGPITTRLRLG